MKNIAVIKPKKLSKKKVGRKWFDGKSEKAVITKCEEVWALGGTDAEASFYANITGASLSRYLAEKPKVKEFRNRLREKPILKARQTINNNLDDPTTARWYLEKKRSKEFSNKLEVAHDVEVSHSITPESQNAIDNLFELFETNAREIEKKVIIDVEAIEEKKDDKDGK